MSMEFGFAYGPATADGGFDEIFGDDGLKDGFFDIEDVGLPKYGTKHVVEVLGLNIKGQMELDIATAGKFLNFTDGGLSQRYLRLAPRLPQLTELKECLPSITDEYFRLWLEVFVENCEHALDVGGDRAILLIY